MHYRRNFSSEAWLIHVVDESTKFEMDFLHANYEPYLRTHLQIPKLPRNLADIKVFRCIGNLFNEDDFV